MPRAADVVRWFFDPGQDAHNAVLLLIVAVMMRLLDEPGALFLAKCGVGMMLWTIIGVFVRRRYARA